MPLYFVYLLLVGLLVLVGFWCYSSCRNYAVLLSFTDVVVVDCLHTVCCYLSVGLLALRFSVGYMIYCLGLVGSLLLD